MSRPPSKAKPQAEARRAKDTLLRSIQDGTALPPNEVLPHACSPEQRVLAARFDAASRRHNLRLAPARDAMASPLI